MYDMCLWASRNYGIERKWEGETGLCHLTRFANSLSDGDDTLVRVVAAHVHCS